jgi:EAL domain-containing protein (putative c-di-GMP-specific phosphodiesterase class I)
VNDFRFTWESKAFTIGVSAGVTIVTADTTSVGMVLSEADSACYMAKDAGRNRVHVYQANDVALAQRRGEMQWVSRINSALAQNRFVLYGQPIVPIEQIYAPESIDQDVSAEIHLEVLIRMLDENGQQIPPGAFIPSAERYHLMPAIDRWVVRTMFEWLRVNAERFSLVNCWTINLSGQSLSDDSLLEFVREELKRSSFSANRICFEITETAAVANLKGATEMISRLKTEGCHFALDDFGSGMSSFAYLKNLPVDFLKIDGNFIRDITRDRVDRAMVEAVNQIGQVMGIQTIAEFVESKAILDALHKIGVDYAQGYAIASPVPLSSISEEFLARFMPSQLEIA